MAYFVQHLSNEGVVSSVFTELSASYAAFLRKHDADPVKETKAYPEVSQWVAQASKLMDEKDTVGVFKLCCEARNKVLNPETVDGRVACSA